MNKIKEHYSSIADLPYEIGFAHGKLCENEIINVYQHYWEAYDKLKNMSDGEWLPLSYLRRED
jgi:hypothetical protein